MRCTSRFLNWLKNISLLQDFTLHALPGDASFRRYFRITQANQTYIAMDASAEKNSCKPFVTIAETLRANQLLAPRILAQDITAGFLLLSDLGDDLYLKKLHPHNADHLYQAALEALTKIRSCDTTGLPTFDADSMLNELNLFIEWFLIQHLQITLTESQHTLLKNTFDFLTKQITQQPYVFMHRDFHAGNLFTLANQQTGIIDFQDACLGPITYDVVSLLRDCYVAWPDVQVEKWALNYHQKIAEFSISPQKFLYYFDLTGLQRHLKALMIFSRKYRRDHNQNYLQHIPRTLNYALKISQKYPECHSLFNFLHHEVLQKCEA